MPFFRRCLRAFKAGCPFPRTVPMTTLPHATLSLFQPGTLALIVIAALGY